MSKVSSPEVFELTLEQAKIVRDNLSAGVFSPGPVEVLTDDLDEWIEQQEDHDTQ